MLAASNGLNFEKAAEIRDRLRAIAKVTARDDGANPTTFSEGDVIGIFSQGGQTCVQVFFFRAGQNWGNSSHLEALARKMAETASQTRLLGNLKDVFDLEAPPERIEVYDNSHIQGTNAVGAFIVAGPDGFIRREYRTFNIKDVETEPGDDYAMMREVVSP